MSRRAHPPHWLLKALLVGLISLGAAAGWQQATVAAQAPAPHPPAHAPHWSYEGAGDPSHWAALSPEFALCGTGHQQSPIDIVTAATTPLTVGAGFEAARFDRSKLGTVPVDIVNNGHTVQIDTVGSGTLVIGTDRYVLQQFHFHTPSEHTVDGRSYPLEVHFVHKTSGGKLAVVGLLFEEGAENPALAPFWSHLPTPPRPRSTGRPGEAASTSASSCPHGTTSTAMPAP